MSRFRRIVRSVAITLVAPVAGFVLIMLLELLLKVEVPKLLGSVINLSVVSLLAFWGFPSLLGIPFGRVPVGEFLRRSGLYFPEGTWKHILLGLILAACTLSGMLMASLLSGKYEVNLDSINLAHIVFSLNPGIWEELFYRGVLMLFLLSVTHSLRKAFLIQLVLFGVMHVKGFDLWALIDVFSVIILAAGFTYTAYKTRLLIAGIVFHFVHDTLLFFVQTTGTEASNTLDNVRFYLLLWVMVGVACLLVRVAVDRFGVRAPDPFYDLVDAEA